MSIAADKIRKQITFSKTLLDKAEKQAEKEYRNLSGLVAVALEQYLNKANGEPK